MARLAQEHAATVQSLEDQVAHEKEEKETVSQLVGRSDTRSERERADIAEAKSTRLSSSLRCLQVTKWRWRSSRRRQRSLQQRNNESRS